MNYLRLESEIISSVQTLNGSQKNDVLDYIKSILKRRHSSMLYRSKAMKEIQEALKSA